jgi:hypothetical protein
MQPDLLNFLSIKPKLLKIVFLSPLTFYTFAEAMKKIILLLAVVLLTGFRPAGQSMKIAVLKYSGGGDWYANLDTSLKNLIDFCNKNLGTSIAAEQDIVEVGSPDLFNYPFVHMTGHGNVVFNPKESENLRNYLIGGGFLHISDNYGMDKFIRPQMKMVFPELDFVEIPFNHPVFHQKFDFPGGLPKIHEHDGTSPKGFGLFYNGRMICFYDFECDLGDGWEDAEVHKDSPEARQKALKMGANLIQYAFSN